MSDAEYYRHAWERPAPTVPPAPKSPDDHEEIIRKEANKSLPKATVQKIVTEILPPSSGMGFTKEARDLLIECCVEFITLISSEANEISEKESKKTIACEHITKALEALGFGDYVQDIMEVASEHKEQSKVSIPFGLVLFMEANIMVIEPREEG